MRRAAGGGRFLLRFSPRFRQSGKRNEPMVRTRLRIRFRKQGDLRLIGHHDLVRAWERLLRRAGLKLRMSEGFHRRPKLSFPSALSIGLLGIDEALELELDGEYSALQVEAAMLPHLPPGLSVNSVETLPPHGKPAQVVGVTFELDVPPARQAQAAQRIQQWLAETSHVVHRPDGRPLDWRPLFEDLRLADGRLRMAMRVTRQGSIRPRDLLAVLELQDLEQQECYLTRTAVELEA
jgi:radical SAM-linked protein